MARTDDHLDKGEVPEVPEEQQPGTFHASDESAQDDAPKAEDSGDDGEQKSKRGKRKGM
jgi:hypothetical protein